jgi:hypothetical protein
LSQKPPKTPDDASKTSAGTVIELNQAGAKADALREARREAKASNLQKRFSAARIKAETKSAAAARLKKIFKASSVRPKK